MALTLFALIVLLIVFLTILFFVTGWKIFRIAGKPGWAIVVPFYNGWTLAKIGGKPGWWGLLISFSVSYIRTSGSIPVPFVVAEFAFVAIWYVLLLLISLGVARNFGRSRSFGYLLGLLPFVGYPVLAFGKANYKPGKDTKASRQDRIIVCSIAVAIFAFSAIPLYHYSQQDHSIYANLTTDTYSGGNTHFSFKYPSAMRPDPSGLQELNAAKPGFTALQMYYYPGQFYNQDGQSTSSTVIAAGYFVIPLGGSGSEGLKPCTTIVTNTLRQENRVCVRSEGVETDLEIRGPSSDKVYILQFAMLATVYKAHPKVWIEIERSFTYG